MRGINNQVKTALIFLRRWTGVAFCLLFLSWFCSGVAMMYSDYPMVSSAERLARSPALDASTIRLTPNEAFTLLQADALPDRVRVSVFDGRPAYAFYSGPERQIVYADNGQIQTEFAADLTLRIASTWTGQRSEIATVEENKEEDQWTVSGEFRRLRPIRKYSWPDGEQVYVSTVTGEVVQYTTAHRRMVAYLGPIPHWLYFTPLRKHGSRWSRVVIWVSGVATAVVLLGLGIGVWTYSPSKRFRYAGAPSAIPYVGSKRWHMALGLLFGPLACTWAFSGMLSMDPFPNLQSGSSEETAGRLAEALRQPPATLAQFDSKPPGAALQQLGSGVQPRQLELTSFIGEPVYLATTAANRSMIVPVNGDPSSQLNPDRIIEAVSEAVRPIALAQVRAVTDYDACYLDRRHLLPLPAIFVQLNDAESTMYYIDPKTAQIVEAYDSRSRRNRWLYHGLHSTNFPWLYRHRPAWDLLLLVLLAGCITLSITSLILAWKVLDRSLGKKGSRLPITHRSRI